MSLVRPWVGPILAPGHNLNKLSRGPLGHATYQIQGSRKWFQTRRFYHVFPIDKDLCKTCDPLGWSNFWPQGDHLNKFGRGPLGNALGLMVSDEKIVSCFPYISLC